MTKVQNIVGVSKETYTSKDGKQKRTYTTYGTAFTDKEGRISLKFDTIPTEWNSVFISIMDKPKD